MLNEWIRRCAPSIVWCGVGLSTALSVAVALADRRGSNFFEEGALWAWGHMLGGATLLGTFARWLILIVVPARTGEPVQTHFPERVAWGMLGFGGWLMVERLMPMALA